MKRIAVPAALQALSRHIGREAAVHARELVAEILGDPTPDPVAERELREAIVSLRLEGHHVCGHPSSGYYMAASAEELDGTCTFLYERAMTTLTQIAAMKRISLPDLRGQLHLPT